MTDPSPAPQATIKQGRRFRFSYVWIAPVIAAVVGGFLFYKSEIDVGPTITITFDNGTNISNSAKVVYRGVQVGAVQSVELDAGLDHVNVVAQLDKSAAGLARAESQFWVVEPRISVGEITGLDTLLSGSYIEVAPGSGDETTKFVGLPDPPVVTAGETKFALSLEADDAGSLEVDAPVLYRGIKVGAVTGLKLPEDDSRIRIDIALHPEHAALVRTNSIFWRASGIRASLGGLDPTIDIGSLASLARGGISFATPQEAGDPASANAVFELRDDPPDEVKIEPAPDGLKLVLTTESASVAEDAPVYYRELAVGRVLQSRLNEDASGIEIEVLIEPAHASLVNTNSAFWNVSGLHIDLDLADPKIDIESLKALLVGGIAFATPSAAGESVKAGATFPLLDQEPGSNANGTVAAGRRFILVADELGSITVGDPIYYRQVEVGKVAQTELIPDGTAVAISVRIEEAHAELVRERSVFWNASGIHANLSLLDPSIDVESAKALLGGGIAFATPATGGGAPAAADAEFRLYSEEEGKQRTRPAAPGLHVVLTADQLGSVARGDPVYYREVEVGEVTAVGFEDGAPSVLVHAVVRQRYAPLVQEGSVFWNAGGLHAKFGLFSGASIDVESLKALLAGGVAFATPEAEGGAQAADGSHFVLHDKPEDEWLTWRPSVQLGPAEAESPLPRIEMAATEVSVEDMAPAAYVATTASHVRQGPGTTYRVVDTLAKDATVEVTGKVQEVDWYRVGLANGGIGYVWAKLLKPAEQADGH